MELKCIIFSVVLFFVSSFAREPSYKCHRNISSWQGNLSFPMSSSDNVKKEEELTCVWSLSVSSGNIIKLTVTELRVGNDSNCSNSYLEIYDGDSLMTKRMCWLNVSLNFLSTTSQLSIRLVISSNDLFRTFRAHHQGICSLTVNSWSGVLSSPNYPNSFLSNQNCSWRFPDGGNGYKTKFIIKHLNFSIESNCKQNRLTIASNTEKIDICSSTIPSSLSLDTSSVVVIFQSKQNYNKFTGFEIEYVVEDVDECITNQHKCHKEANCKNTIGSYVCECNIYHTGNGTFCADIDECSMGLQVCKPNTICTNTEGAYDCDCKPGFKGNGHVRCVNIDECKKSQHNCDVNAKCTDTVGSYVCICEKHYTGNGTYCEDINECLHGISGCHRNAKCLNKIGSHECICDSGYSGDGQHCVDIDECLSNIPLCQVNAKCKNIPGSFICDCNPGFTGDGYNCSDVDECSVNETAVCHSDGECNNTIGSFKCHCSQGYTGDGFNCTDLDECYLNTSTCHANAKCSNTIGSYRCNCDTGFTGNGFNCTDLDECYLNTSMCHANAKCSNTIGSYRCNCDTGFTGNGFNCTDLDECYLNTSMCHANAKCSNTIGSYRCNCDTSFTGNGFNCTDLDECYLNTSTCHANAKCSNTIGSYRCNCDTGFTGNGFNCTDLDECYLNISTCHANAKCSNTIGSYRCNCDTGFTGNGFNCTDLDECYLSISTCHANAKCSNAIGSYRCNCDTGFTGNGFNCTDLDECYLNTSTCHANAKCSNTIGSYRCNCDTGFTGNGFNCIDECYLNISTCHANAKCSNSIGSYRCNCDTGFTGNSLNCTDLDECYLNISTCHANAKCSDTIGSYRCNCDTGFTGNGFNCTDIDECCWKKKKCHPNAECINVVGSYYCRCRHGYIGDGFSCTDQDECKMNINLCDNNANCININGSYNCQCDDSYSGDGFHCADILNGSTYCLLQKRQDITWENTVAGDVRTYLCPNNHLGNCTRKCSNRGIWESPDMSNCISPQFVSLYNQFHDNIVAKNDVLRGSDELANLTSRNRTRLYGGDIIASVRILKRLVFNSNRSRLSNFSKKDIETFTTSYSETVSNLLDTEKRRVWEGVKKRKFTALTLITNVEEFGDTLISRQTEILQQEKNLTTLEERPDKVFVNMENIDVSSQVIDVKNFSGLLFGKSSFEDDYGVIRFPSNLFGDNTKEHSSGIFSVIYRNLATILNDQENSSVDSSFDNDIINSVIITAQVRSENSMSFNNLVDPVTLVFKHVKQQSDVRHQCVYLNTDQGFGGSKKVWLNSGCSVYSSNNTHTVCHCFHLTNFALLLDMHGVQNTMSSKHDQILTVLSYITCSISMVSAFVAVTIFHILGLTSDRILIHKHLALNIFLTQMVFIISPRCISVHWLCKVVSISLHFFLLALFSWMLVEGLYMYKSLIKVFTSRAHGTFKKYFILGYGVPLVIVVISCGLFWDHYGTGEKTCWISQDVIISALVPPLGVVILINAGILSMVIRVLLHPSSIRARERDVVREVKSSLKASITLLPLLGLCWIFGFLHYNEDTILFSYAFVILNASQGFCFLIFHCLNSNEVKTAWKKRSRTFRRSEYPSPHSSSSTPIRVPNSTSFPDFFSLSLSSMMSRNERLTGTHQQNCLQDIQLKIEGECLGVQNINPPKIFGSTDFDGAILLRDLKNSVKLKEVKPRDTSN